MSDIKITSTKLAKNILIVGAPIEKLSSQAADKVIPEILLNFSDNPKDLEPDIKDIVFPSGYSLLSSTSNEDEVSFYPIVMTNEKSDRKFLYVLKMHETYKEYKVPIAICIVSIINDAEGFNKLLNEVYYIVKSDTSNPSKKIELINYLTFVNSILVPPPHTLLSLKLNHTTAQFYFNSYTELPMGEDDINVNILFNFLDIRKIIKLWIQVLREGQTIIYGSNPYTLYAVCDSILKLIFPIQWNHPYISCACKSHLTWVIDMPSPFILGVLSSNISIAELKKKTSGVLIVDLETGEFHGSKIPSLPRQAEILFKKQVLYVKNPELFRKAKLLKDSDFNKDVINTSESTSRNFRRIFFQFFKENFSNYKEYMINEKIIIPKFFNDLKDQEMSQFLVKLLKSGQVQSFISEDLEYHRRDGSNKKIFDEILSQKKDAKMSNVYNALKVEMTIPSVNPKRVKKYMSEMNVTDSDELDLFLMTYFSELKEGSKKDYNSPSKLHHSRSNISSCSISSSVEEGGMILTEENKTNSFRLSYQETEIKKIEVVPMASKEKSSPKKSEKSEKPESKAISTKSIKESEEKKISEETSDGSFMFVDELNGFIPFVKKYIEKFQEKKYKFTDIIFKRDFLSLIIDQSNRLLETLPVSPEDVIQEGNESEMISPFLPRLKMSDNSLRHVPKNSSSLSLSSIMQGFDPIKFSNVSSNHMQQLLFYAYYLEYIFLEYKKDAFEVKREEIIEIIVKLYHNAIKFDSKDFPYDKYSAIITRLPRESKNKFRMNIPDPLRGSLNASIEEDFAGIRRTMSKMAKKFHINPPQNKNLNSSCTVVETDNDSQHSGGPASQSKKEPLTPKVIKKDYFKSMSKEIKQEIRESRISKLPKDKPLPEKTPFASDSKLTQVQASEKKRKVSDFTKYTETSFGINNNLRKEIVLNKVKMKIKFQSPELIQTIGQKILLIIEKKEKDNIKLDQVRSLVDYQKDLEELKNLIDELQFVNPMKLTTNKAKYAFWLNAFNFLVIYTILYTGFHPRNFDDWDILLSNAMYSIGRYEISLYEIEVNILSCFNFHEKNVACHDEMISKFMIREKDTLTSLALFFPIMSKLFELKIYTEENFEEDLFKVACSFFKKNVIFNEVLNEIEVSEYLNKIIANFCTVQYELYQYYLPVEVFEALQGGTKTKIKEVAWDLF